MIEYMFKRISSELGNVFQMNLDRGRLQDRIWDESSFRSSFYENIIFASFYRRCKSLLLLKYIGIIHDLSRFVSKSLVIISNVIERIAVIRAEHAFEFVFLQTAAWHASTWESGCIITHSRWAESPAWEFFSFGYSISGSTAEGFCRSLQGPDLNAQNFA